MDEQILEAELQMAYENHRGEVDLLIKAATALVKGILADAKKAMQEMPDIEDPLKVIISILDRKTNTGIFDMIDAPLANLVISKIINDKMRLWYKDVRNKLLIEAGNQGI